MRQSSTASPDDISPSTTADRDDDELTPGRTGLLAAGARGAQGSGSALPYFAEIQRAFGRHDISNIRAHLDGDAERATRAVGAHAYAYGDHVVFGGAPDLHTAAHEAAHVVQQRAGHAPDGGISHPSDHLEHHAEEVAALVTRGQSAEAVLDRVAPSRSTGAAPARAVQMLQGLKVNDTCKVAGEFGKIFTIVEVAPTRYKVQPETGEAFWVDEPKVLRASKLATKIDFTPTVTTDGKAEEVKPVEKKSPSTAVPLPLGIGSEVSVQGHTGIHRVARIDGRTVYVVLEGQANELPFEKYKVTVLTEHARGVLEKKRRDEWLHLGATVKCPLLASSPSELFVVEKIAIGEIALRGEGRTLVAPAWSVVPASTVSRAQDKPKAGDHKLYADEMARDAEHARELGTPSAQVERMREILGKKVSPITSSAVDFDDTARIDVTSSCTEVGVTINFVVTSNPKYMCERVYPKGKGPKTPEIKDLVPLYLEYQKDVHPEMIAVVEPTAAQNACSGSVSYTWLALAKALNLPAKSEEEARANFGKEEPDGKSEVTTGENPEKKPKISTLGVKAQWLAVVAGKNNQNHTSGGLGQKGGSGAVPLVPISSEDYLKTETNKRVTDWNRGEKLRPGRPVFGKFEALMKEGKELATTLEAESEYMTTPERFQTVVARMTALATTEPYWKKFSILKMSMSDPKVYVDTYYDIAGSKGHDTELLQRGVVLRERHVASDPADTFLMAVKGKSHSNKDGESIRLAAQANLSRAKVGGEGGSQDLAKFATDTSIDNAFGRTLDHALGGGNGPGGTQLADLLGSTGTLAPALRVTSTRHKFLMELDGGTAIDFSADEAVGAPIVGGKVDEKRTAKVHSFEFGVGHPSLTASATPSNAKSESTIERPYHSPQDLTNDALFAKKDYKQFQALRDEVIAQALGEKRGELPRGGNKAQLLAGMLGMLPEQ